MTIYLRVPKSIVWLLLLLLLSFAVIIATFSAARFLSITHIAGNRVHDATSPVTHLIGGFGISTVNDIQAAAADGIQTVFTYGPAYPEHSALGSLLGTTLHMTQVEAQPWELLYQYECHKLFSQHKATNGYCSQDYPGMTLTALLAAVKADILVQRQNSQLIGIWILDDWPGFDQGGAASILPQITQMIHAFAPNLPTICGFGAEIGPDHTDVFDANVFANYSIAACDEVAFYIYSASAPQSNYPTAAYDWSMHTLLPKMFSALRARGWNPRTSPLIGIPQAFAGKRIDGSGLYEIAPTAAEIALQSASFCKAGANDIVYYTWQDGSLVNLQTPANNTALAGGVRAGIQQCQQIWKQAVTP